MFTDHTRAFLPILAECAQKAEASLQGMLFQVEMYITQEKQPGHLELLQRLSAQYKWQLVYKRMNAQDVIERISSVYSHACMHTCGSAEFMTSVKNAGIKQGWSVHDEVFEF